MKYELTCLVPSQTTPADFTYTSVILPPSGFPVPMVTVADEPSEATTTAAAAVTEDTTDATTVIVETDEAWEAKLLEDMKVAVSHTLNGLDMV